MQMTERHSLLAFMPFLEYLRGLLTLSDAEDDQSLPTNLETIRTQPSLPPYHPSAQVGHQIFW